MRLLIFAVLGPVLLYGCQPAPENYPDQLLDAVNEQSRLQFESLVDVQEIAAQLSSGRLRTIGGELGEEYPSLVDQAAAPRIGQAILAGVEEGALLDSLAEAALIDLEPYTHLTFRSPRIVEHVDDRAVIAADLVVDSLGSLEIQGILEQAGEDTWQLTQINNEQELFDWLSTPRRNRMGHLDELRQSLRVLASAEEIHYSEVYSYTTDLEALQSRFEELQNTQAVIEIEEADDNGWLATATHPALPDSVGCVFGTGLWAGVMMAPGNTASLDSEVPVCDDDQVLFPKRTAKVPDS